jgi:hypothetical protein
MAQLEISICGPAGVRPRKESALDLILVGLGSAAVLIAFALASRALKAGASTVPPALALAGGLALSAWAIWRIRRREDDAALMEAGGLGFVLLLTMQYGAPKGSAWAFLAAVLPLGPAAVFAWSYARLTRRSDELKRRIVQEALAFGFVAALFASLLGAALEAGGAPRFHWAWMAGALVLAAAVGLARANRRYR